ncbi:MAG: hypothetical protein MZV65_51950 [Chromatiales bacterium]|nr:hypothetical protein [Chromatiales bacterium]
MVASGADGHDLRLGRGQRGHDRAVHHPADEALRLLAAPSPAASRRPSSMGGQIMPPVMGAVAFIMAETHQRALRRDRARRR